MKITITMTKEEKNNTENAILVDPCAHIQCSSIDCERCPLQAHVQKLREVQEDFLKALKMITVEEE